MSNGMIIFYRLEGYFNYSFLAYFVTISTTSFTHRVD